MADTKISALAAETALDGTESFPAVKAGGNVRYTWTALKAAIKTYADTLYPSGSGSSTGSNTGDETAARVATLLHAASAKTTLIDADEVSGTNSAATWGLIRTTWADVWVYVKAKADAVYALKGAITGSTLTMSTGKLLGRNTASTGAVEEITLGTNLSMSGTTLNAAGATPGGSNGAVQGNTSSTFSAIPGYTYDTTTGALTYSFATTANTAAPGFLLASGSVASSGNQQFSPYLIQRAFGWKTTATAASQSVDFKQEVRPTQGTTAPAGGQVYSSQINGGGFQDFLAFSNNGAAGYIGQSYWNGTNFTALTASPGLIVFDNQSTYIIPGPGGVAAGGTTPYGGFGLQVSNSLGVTTNGGAPMSAAHLGVPTTGVIGFSSNSNGYGTKDVGFSRSAPGVVALGSGAQGSFAADIKLRGVWFASNQTYTVGTLPSAGASEGLVVRVSNASAPVVGVAVSGGGSTKCTVQCDGASWIVIWIV